MTTKNTPQKAIDKLKTRTTGQLIDDFLHTNYLSDPEIYTVRGWIMDELERRNPVAYNTWLDLWVPDNQLHALFGC